MRSLESVVVVEVVERKLRDEKDKEGDNDAIVEVIGLIRERALE